MTDMAMFRDCDRLVFGVPRVHTVDEARVLCSTIEVLWQIGYGVPIDLLEEDLEKCRMYFDPVARGHKLRERLGALQPAPAGVLADARRLHEPLVVDAGNGRLLVGIEGRLLVELIHRCDSRDDSVIIPVEEAYAASLYALSVYRSWTRYRLDQVLALREGRGNEVLQATSVGVVLAILVNRSTAPDRAIGRVADEQVRERIDDAIHRAAASFADRISTGRSRSRTEQRLVGGYWLTEARRRLADRLVITDSARGAPSLVYIPEQHRDGVIEFLALDLARRASLGEDALASAFDLLVDTLRTASNQLAGQRMTFERPADTARLRAKLLARFGEARGAGGTAPSPPPKKDQTLR